MVEVLTSVRGPGSIPGCREPSCGAVLDTAFGDKDTIYAQAAAQSITMIDARLAKRPESPTGRSDRRGVRCGHRSLHDRWPRRMLRDLHGRGADHPVWRSILDRPLKAIDAFFLRRLKLEQGLTKANSADLSLLAAQLSAILDSLALRTRAGWSGERLRSLSTGLIRQALGGERNQLQAVRTRSPRSRSRGRAQRAL